MHAHSSHVDGHTVGLTPDTRFGPASGRDARDFIVTVVPYVIITTEMVMPKIYSSGCRKLPNQRRSSVSSLRCCLILQLIQDNMRTLARKRGIMCVSSKFS